MECDHCQKGNDDVWQMIVVVWFLVDLFDQLNIYFFNLSYLVGYATCLGVMYTSKYRLLTAC